MGDAIWLFDWCLWRQIGNTGWVYAGKKPITYDLITEQTGFPERRLRRWLETLRREGYIEVHYTNFKKLRLRVCNPKKLGFLQKDLFQRPDKSGQSDIPKMDDGSTKNGRFNKSRVLSEKDGAEAPVGESPLSASEVFNSPNLIVTGPIDHILQDRFPWIADRQIEYLKASDWRAGKHKKAPKQPLKFLLNWFQKVPKNGIGGSRGKLKDDELFTHNVETLRRL